MQSKKHHYEINTQEDSYSEYALILEDDIRFPFDIDFRALIGSAPKNFGILQLFTSNIGHIKSLWEEYISKGTLWTNHRAPDFGSAGAYIISKNLLKPIIEKIIRNTGIQLSHIHRFFKCVRTTHTFLYLQRCRFDTI